MYVISSLIGIHSLQIDGMPQDMILLSNPIAAHHLPRIPRDLYRLHAVIPLQHRDHLHRQLPPLFETSHMEDRLLAQSDVGVHLGQFRLHQLERSQRHAELLTLQDVFPRLVETELSRTKHPPRNPEPRTVQTRKWPFQTLHRWEGVFDRHPNIIQRDVPCYRSPQRQFSFDFVSSQPGHTLLQDEATDIALFVFSPYHKHICNRRVRDPHLRTIQNPLLSIQLSPCLHRPRIRPMVSLGQSETPDQLSLDKAWQIFLFGLRRGELVDRMNDERALHTERRPVGTVHSLNLFIYQPIGSFRKARPAVLRQGASQQTIFSHQFYDTPVEGLCSIVLEHSREKMRLRELPCRIDDLHNHKKNHVFVLSEEGLEVERVSVVVLRK